MLYLQVPVEYQKQFMDLGWQLVTGGNGKLMPAYTIRAADDEHEDVDCILLGAGKEIAGIDRTSNARECRVHDEIPLRTGHANERWPEVAAILGPLVLDSDPEELPAPTPRSAPDDGVPTIGA
jgi:hypothetical protein